jgi:hypothetical protein
MALALVESAPTKPRKVPSRLKSQGRPEKGDIGPMRYEVVR